MEIVHTIRATTPYFKYMIIFPLYIIINILNICNLIYQLFILQWFIGTSNFFWAYTIIREQISPKSINFTSADFPRTTQCDVTIYNLGNRQSSSIQCLLIINALNEKVFILLWIWYTVLLTYTIIAIIRWIITYVRFYFNNRQKHSFDIELILNYIESSRGKFFTEKIRQKINSSKVHT